MRDTDTVYVHHSEVTSDQWHECRSDGVENVFQPIMLLQQSRDNLIHGCGRCCLTSVAITDSDIVTWRRQIPLSEIRLALHNVLACQTVNPLIQAVRVIRTESVTTRVHITLDYLSILSRASAKGTFDYGLLN